MATRSYIFVKDGYKYRGIYCHHDGYLSHNGKLLKEKFKDIDRVKKLIELGDVSFIDENIPTKTQLKMQEFKNFNDYPKGYTKPYSVRGDKIEIMEFDNIQELLERAVDCWIEFVYVFDGGKWEYIEPRYKRKFKKV